MRQDAASASKLKLAPRYVFSTSDSCVKMWYILPHQQQQQQHNYLSLKHTFAGHHNGRIFCSLIDNRLQLHDHVGYRNVLALENYQLLTGGIDNTIRTWNIETGECTSTIQTEQKVNCMQWWFYNNKKYLVHAGFGASQENDNIYIKEWTQSCQLSSSNSSIRVLKGHTSTITALVVDNNNNQLLSSSYDYNSILWCLKTGTQLRLFEGHKDCIHAMCKIPTSTSSSSLMLTASTDSNLKYWNVETGDLVKNIKLEAYVYALLYDSASQQLVTSDADCVIKVWHLDTNSSASSVECKELVSIQGPFEQSNGFEMVYLDKYPQREYFTNCTAATTMSLSSPPQLVLASDTHGNMCIININTGTVEQKLPNDQQHEVIHMFTVL